MASFHAVFEKSLFEKDFHEANWKILNNVYIWKAKKAVREAIFDIPKFSRLLRTTPTAN